MRRLRAAAAFLLAVGLVAGCRNDPADVAALFPEQRPDAEVMTDFETIYSDSARVKVRIRGPRLLRYQEGNDWVQLFPDGATVEFFDPGGRVSSTMRSGYGIRYEDREQVIVRDSVVWESSAGDRLDTEELIWDAKPKRIYSDRFVRLRQRDQEITGVGFESNEDFTESRVRAIRGVVAVGERRP